jgi:hypothetical protein
MTFFIVLNFIIIPAKPPLVNVAAAVLRAV